MADLDDLDRLAPDVDTDAALDQFRHRRTGRSLSRWPLLVAAAALGLVGIVGIAVLAADDDEAVVAGPEDQASESLGAVAFEVLAVLESAEELGTLRAATAPEELERLVPDDAGPFARVDFESFVVVSITIPDDACPPTLARFDRDGATIIPVFVETVNECEEPLIPKTYLVAIDRDSVESSFSVFLPEDEVYGIDERILVVELGESPSSTVLVDPVDPPDAEPTCAEIERFAEQLVDVGISHDYSASESPEDAAESAELVLSGRLTGGFTSEPELDRVGYEVAIDELHKSPPAADIVDPITIYVDIGAVDPADFAAAIVAEIPVVVMAEWLDRAGGERPFAGIEGFVTGCPGGPLLGFTGIQDEWTEVIDLDDLSTRLGPE